MSALRNLLVPVDFSINSQVALDCAIHVARKSQAKLVILHTYRLLEKDITPRFTTPITLRKSLDKDYEVKFEEMENKYFKQNEIEHEFIIEIGFPLDNIKFIGKTHNIDLVIMGTKGSGNMVNYLGSTTSSVIYKSRIPVLAIPQDVKMNNIENIALVCALKKLKDITVLGLLNEMSEIYHADFHILNIDQNNVSNGVQFSNHKFNRLKNLTHIKGNNTKKKINDYLQQENIDLLSLTPNSDDLFCQLFFTNDLKTPHKHAKIPLLTL